MTNLTTKEIETENETASNSVMDGAGRGSAIVHGSGNRELAPSSANNPVADTLALIERMATNKDVDADKMGKLVDMQIKIMDKQAEMDFNKALARMKPRLPKISKRGMIEFVDKNNNTRRTPYAKYEDIQEAIQPLLTDEGFSLSFNSVYQNNAPTLYECTLSHENGHNKTISMPLPLDTSGSKNNLQAGGSTISYAQRYLVKMMFDLIFEGEDNDGNGECITEHQAKEIKDMLKKTGADVKKFLTFVHAASVDEMLAGDYKKAINLLKAKEAKDAQVS